MRDCCVGFLEVSERTQTMGNMQLYSVVVTRSEEMKKRFGTGAFQSAYGDSGTCGPDGMCGFQPYGQMGGAAQGAALDIDNFLSFLNAATDCAVVYADVL